MAASSFTTPQEAEQAFYEAFQRADLDALMAVWAEDEDVFCVHPGAPRLTGLDKIRESFRQIFQERRQYAVPIAGCAAAARRTVSLCTASTNTSPSSANTARQTPWSPPNVYANVAAAGAWWHTTVSAVPDAEPNPPRRADASHPAALMRPGQSPGKHRHDEYVWRRSGARRKPIATRISHGLPAAFCSSTPGRRAAYRKVGDATPTHAVLQAR